VTRIEENLSCDGQLFAVRLKSMHSGKVMLIILVSELLSETSVTNYKQNSVTSRTTVISMKMLLTSSKQKLISINP